MSDDDDARRIAAGPTTRPVVLVPHDPAWAEAARERGAALHRALGDVLAVVHHVGSTSIPGIEAKPILDLVPVVTTLAALATRRAALEALGYTWWEEFGLPGRRFCILESEDGTRLVHAHCYATGDVAIARHVVFRDYLRAHPGEARAYEAEKRRSARLHPASSRDYNGEKSAFIGAMLERALAWCTP